MKTKDWIGRLVEFRNGTDIREDGIVYIGRIVDAFEEDGETFAIANTKMRRIVEVKSYQTNPDPNWTAQQYDRRRHHRRVFC